MNILHVPYTWLPDEFGGTEHYVRALIQQLSQHGIHGAVAAPGDPAHSGNHSGIDIYRFPSGQGPGASEGVPDRVAARAFEEILRAVTPSVVHLHARTAAVSELLIEAAKAFGARTVVTYHAPTWSCLRGTMLINGVAPCDGVLDARRCTACVLRSHGLIEPLPSLLAQLPSNVGRVLQRAGLQKGPWLALRMRQIAMDHILRTQHWLAQADLVVAPCQWVADLLLSNDLPAERLRLCRQGLAHPRPLGDLSQPPTSGTLRLGCFARLDPTKGIDVLLRALQRIPRAPLELSIHGVTQQASSSWLQQLREMAQHDSRVRWLPPLEPDQVLNAMAQLDLVLVPSVCLETGPLVVLEAFAAGTPVLGSELGGIAELVRSDANGLLLPPGDVESGADALGKIAADRSPIQRWREGIESPRTMAEVAVEMAGHYRHLLAC